MILYRCYLITSLLLCFITAPSDIFAKVFDLDELSQTVGIDAYQKAFDTASEDDNSVVFQYKPGKTFHIALREGANTLLSLPVQEIIQTFSVGDTTSVKFIPFEKE